MAKKHVDGNNFKSVSAQPRLHQHASEIQRYGTVTQMQPLQLEEPVRLEITERLNQLLADTMTLRDLYKNPTGRLPVRPFISCILLYDKHFGEQVEVG